jgi:hypothetical protein
VQEKGRYLALAKRTKGDDGRVALRRTRGKGRAAGVTRLGAAHAARFPNPNHVDRDAVAGNCRATRSFAQNACCLAAAPNVSVQEIFPLAKVAEGEEWS